MLTFPKLDCNTIVIVLILLSLIACEKVDLHERDAITTMYYTLEAVDSSQENVTLYYEDMDGIGGREPIVIDGYLHSNSVYKGTLNLRFASEKSMNSIEHSIMTLGILKHPETHQVFYSISPEMELSMRYTDRDTFGFPVGLTTLLTTGRAGSGQLTITIRYDVNKSANGVAQGDMTNAGGAEDIAVNFGIVIK